MDEIILEEGKYRFHKENYLLCCDRHGESWRDFVGDNAVHALFDECIDLKRKEVNQMSEAIGIIFDGGEDTEKETLMSKVYESLFAHPAVSVITRTGRHELCVILKKVSLPPSPTETKGERV